MSDELKHECGVALLKIRRPEAGSDSGLELMSLLLEKQHNRGQDGAGLGIYRTDAPPGSPYFKIYRDNGRNPLAKVLEKSHRQEFPGEIYLGHLRYGTFGNNDLADCHPLLHECACRNRSLLLAGNFNLTNSSFLLRKLTASGHHLTSSSDTVILLHSIGHELEKNPEQPLEVILANAAADWDGGFMICGVTGDGRAFALRDAAGVRSGFYYADENVAMVASERPPLQTALALQEDAVREIPPGHVLIWEKDNSVILKQCLKPQPVRSCVFERVYFSRGNDAAIQTERRELGKLLRPAILDAVEHDVENTFFSFIPNTAAASFYGLLSSGHLPRFGQLVVKDAKFRTFISDAGVRKKLNMHIYDLVYGIVRPGVDRIVLLDDSIVRGNTIGRLLLPLLDRLQPKKIVIASASPPVCYPDCYGIDMANLSDLVAFQAAVSILKRSGRQSLIDECIERAAEEDDRRNHVKPMYTAIPFDELCAEIGRLLTPPDLKAQFQVVYQTPQHLRQACPNHTGDWYFTGNYPTPGGFRVVNHALVNYAQGNNQRAY